MQTVPILDEETLIILDLDTEEPILCESWYENVEKGTPPHIAHWYAGCVCGSPVIAICENRRHLAYIHDGWLCSPQGCGKFHPYSEIQFTLIKK